MATARQSNWQRINQWIQSNMEGFGWVALWLFGCLLVVLASGLYVASRSRTMVSLINNSGVAIHDVTLRPAAVSSREPRHFVPHLAAGGEQTFVVYPLGPCDLIVDYLDSAGGRHHWEGARVSPHGGRTTLRLRAIDEISVT